jgi:hypothetical protein
VVRLGPLLVCSVSHITDTMYTGVSVRASCGALTRHGTREPGPRALERDRDARAGPDPDRGAGARCRRPERAPQCTESRVGQSDHENFEENIISRTMSHGERTSKQGTLAHQREPPRIVHARRTTKANVDVSTTELY